MKASVLFTFLLLSGQLIATDHQVSGRVLSLNNTPIGGVNVLLKGTAIATATDMNGFFRISLPEGPVVLAFRFLKQKPLEHTLVIRVGFQYQVNVTMAGKTQTFNKSLATTAELPVDTPLIRGRVVSQDGGALYGVTVVQTNSQFKTITDPEGYFSLPVPLGKNILKFTYPGTKDLQVSVDTGEVMSYGLDVTLVAEKGKYRTVQSSAKALSPVNNPPENNR